MARIKKGEAAGVPVEKLNTSSQAVNGVFNGLVDLGAVVVTGLYKLLAALVAALSKRGK